MKLMVLLLVTAALPAVAYDIRVQCSPIVPREIRKGPSGQLAMDQFYFQESVSSDGGIERMTKMVDSQGNEEDLSLKDSRSVSRCGPLKFIVSDDPFEDDIDQATVRFELDIINPCSKNSMGVYQIQRDGMRPVEGVKTNCTVTQD